MNLHSSSQPSSVAPIVATGTQNWHPHPVHRNAGHIHTAAGDRVFQPSWDTYDIIESPRKPSSGDTKGNLKELVTPNSVKLPELRGSRRIIESDSDAQLPKEMTTTKYVAQPPDASDMIAINFSCLRHRVPETYHPVYIERVIQELNAPSRPVNLEKVPPKKILRRNMCVRYEECDRSSQQGLPVELSYGEILNSDTARKTAKYFQKLKSAEKHKRELEGKINRLKRVGEYPLGEDVERRPEVEFKIRGGRTPKPLAKGQLSPLIYSESRKGTIEDPFLVKWERKGGKKQDKLLNLDRAPNKIPWSLKQSSSDRNTFPPESQKISVDVPTRVIASEKVEAWNTVGSARSKGEKNTKMSKNRHMVVPAKDTGPDVSHEAQRGCAKTILPPLLRKETSPILNPVLSVPHSKRERESVNFKAVLHKVGNRELLRIKHSATEEEPMLFPHIKRRSWYNRRSRCDSKLTQGDATYTSFSGVTQSCPQPTFHTEFPSNISKQDFIGPKPHPTTHQGRNKLNHSSHADLLNLASSHEQMQNYDSTTDTSSQGATQSARFHVKRYSCKDIKEEIGKWFGTGFNEAKNDVVKYNCRDLEREVKGFNICKEGRGTWRSSREQLSAPGQQMMALPTINDHTSSYSCPSFQRTPGSYRLDSFTPLNDWNYPTFNASSFADNNIPLEHVPDQQRFHQEFGQQSQTLAMQENDNHLLPPPTTTTTTATPPPPPPIPPTPAKSGEHFWHQAQQQMRTVQLERIKPKPVRRKTSLNATTCARGNLY